MATEIPEIQKSRANSLHSELRRRAHLQDHQRLHPHAHGLLLQGQGLHRLRRRDAERARRALRPVGAGGPGGGRRGVISSIIGRRVDSVGAPGTVFENHAFFNPKERLLLLLHGAYNMSLNTSAHSSSQAPKRRRAGRAGGGCARASAPSPARRARHQRRDFGFSVVPLLYCLYSSLRANAARRASRPASTRSRAPLRRPLNHCRRARPPTRVIFRKIRVFSSTHHCS